MRLRAAVGTGGCKTAGVPSWILAIDFGTSYTVAAARVEGRAPEIVEIAGERRMPSVVMVDPQGDVFVGRTAEDLSVTHPGSTLRALKNRLGDQTPAILGGRPHQVVTLVAALLREVYDHVVEQFGSEPTEVRLTHPATWNQPRLNRLIEAAAKAGLPNPLLVPEPVAAALSYAADVGIESGRPIVVYDLGGGTFDSAVVTARNGGFTVVGRPGGDQHIGGELFDELIVNHIGSQLEPDAWEAIQVGEDPLWRQIGAAIRNEARKAKEALSSHPYVNVLVPLPAGLRQVRLTRDEFHDMVRPYIAETVATLQRCITEAGVQPGDLAGISLVGGSSRSPIVEEMVRAAFPMVPISRRGDPKATVAAGATLADRPSASTPGLWKSPVTQEASPGTAQQRVRLAPPPVSEPPQGPTSLQPPPHGPVVGSTPIPPPPPADLVATLPVAAIAPTPATPSARPPTPATPPARPPTPPAPTPETPPARPPAPAAPTPPAPTPPAPTPAIPPAPSGSERGAATAASAGRGSRRRLLVVGGLIAAAVIAVVAVIVTRPDAASAPDGVGSATNTAAGDAPSTGVSSAATNEPTVSADATIATIDDNGGDTTNSTDTTDSTDTTGGTDDTAGSTPDSSGGDNPAQPAVGDQLEVLAGHKAEALSVEFSPDGQRLVTGSHDGTAIVWDVATGDFLATLVGHTDEVYSAVFSPDGTNVATTGADATVRLWDSASGKELAVFTGHTDVVYQVRYSPDGGSLLSASRDGTARLWDLATRTGAAVYTGATESLYFAEFSPNGEQIVGGGQDDNVLLWSVFDPGNPLLLTGHTADVQIGSFSPDGTILLSGADDGRILVWNATTGDLIYDLGNIEGGVASATFSHDGTLLMASGADNTAALWGVAQGNLLGDLAGHEGSVLTAVFSPDDSQVLTASADGTARLWQLQAPPPPGIEIAVLDNDGAAVPGAVFSPDGSRIATVNNSGVAIIWAA